MSEAKPGRRRRLSVHAAILSIALLTSGTALAFVALRAPEPPGSIAERARSVAATLRCPVCQNLSVADSPSPLAQQMRATIARELQAGRTPEQIKSRFVDAYGEWILLSPPRSGLNLVAWVAPMLLLFGGVVAAGFVVRRWTARETAEGGAVPSAEVEAPQISPDERQMLQRALSGLPEEPA